MNNLIEEMEKYAKEEDIPIMQKDGIEFLLDFIKKNNIKNILEIGSAIGYSSIRMALVNDYISITTIERDKTRYLKALENIKKGSLDTKIEIINDDALNIDVDKKFDLIFIDAAKSKNIDFFEKYKSNLSEKGFIVTDNLSFHGLVDVDINSIESRNVRGLVRKIRKYIEFLKENKEFKTEFLSVGDGISISQKISN